jgi:monoamine oxidase
MSDTKAIQHFVKLLDKIFASSENATPATNAFVKGYVKDWSKEKFIRGGYSSAGLNAEGMRNLLRKNVDEKIFFAGEATSTMYYSCIHGAMESAESAVHEVLMSLRKSKL